MTTDRLELDLPTKVMLAGEYAVLQPGGEALALALSPGLHLTIQTADRFAVTLPDLGLHETWSALPATLPPGPAAWVVAAWQEWHQNRGTLPPLQLTARRPPRALPVGTSAALCAGTLRATARLLGPEPPPGELLALAQRAHHRAQGGAGSGYDLATILLGGLVRTRNPVTSSSSRRRPGLHLPLVVADTGVRAPTARLLHDLRQAGPAATPALAAHGTASAALVHALWQGTTTTALLHAVERANETLATLAHAAGLDLFPAPIPALLHSARQADIPARVSGAGAGDLVVAFPPDWPATRRLVKQWGQTLRLNIFVAQAHATSIELVSDIDSEHLFTPSRHTRGRPT